MEEIGHKDTAELLLSIGGVVGHVRLQGVPQALLADVRKAYAAFTLPCSRAVVRAFSLQISLRDRPAAPIDPDAKAEPPLVEADRDHVAIKRLDFAAALTRGRPEGPEADGGCFFGVADCQATPVALESLLRVLWSVFLPRAGGALFHACGFCAEGQGILAPGPSGAGKSTLARKVSRTEQLLSDEVVAVHRARDGRWRISATPFFGELQRTAASMQSWPLAGIAFLEKRAALGTESLSLGEGVQRALACLLCFQTDVDTIQQNFELVINLCTDVPAFICGSRVDSPFADMVSALRPRLASTGGPAQAPHNPREMISAIRANLVRSGIYAFQPRGSSMRPWLCSGDSLFVEAVSEKDLRPGDVVLYWRVGRSAEGDALVCHRLVGRRATARGSQLFAKGDAQSNIESFHDGEEAQVLGRVRALSRAGKSYPMPGPLANMAILLCSMLMIPLFKLMSR